MCTTKFRDIIQPGSLAAELFDRGDLRRCTTEGDIAAQERIAHRLTPAQHLAEVELARRALAETLGEKEALDAAAAADPAALRSFKGALGVVRSHGSKLALSKLGWANDELAVATFANSFAGTLIDVADDRQYQSRDAA